MASNINQMQANAQRNQGRVSLGDRDLDNLLLWREPRRSGIVFGAITAVYLLLEWSKYSLLNLLANSLLIVVAITFIWNNVATFANRPGVPLPGFLAKGVQENEFHRHVEPVRQGLNKALVFVRRIVQGKEVVLTVQTAGILFLIAKVGNFFSTLGLAYTLVVLAFTIPKVYEIKKDDIDQVASKVYHESRRAHSQYVQPYVDKIPRASTSTQSPAGRPGAYQSTADSASIAPNGSEPRKVM